MDINDFGHFSNPSLLILASLAGGEKHGYAMMEDIYTMTGVPPGSRDIVWRHHAPRADRIDRGPADG